MADKGKYPIKFVSIKTGINQLLIRTWENRYNIVTPERSSSNRRLYSNDDLKKLTFVKKLIDNGYKIGDVAALSFDELKNLAIEENDNQRENVVSENLIEESILLVKKYDSARLQNLIDIQSIRLSRFDFIQEFIYPLMMKIGEYWERGELSVSHEHFASAIIRSTLGKMIVSNEKENAPLILIGTPTNQNHELMALSIAVLVSQHNVKTVYLGSSVPAIEIIKSANETKASMLILSIISPEEDEELLKDLKILDNELDIDIVIGGFSALAYYQRLKVKNIIYENSIDTLLNRIKVLYS